MKLKPISIANSSTSEEQISTPSWAAYNNNPRTQFQKMSRLDQLLSRNEEIYQNMRSQLQEITKSNQNIDANINIIKPLYESGALDDELSGAQTSGYREPYTFQHQAESTRHPSADYYKISGQMQEVSQKKQTAPIQQKSGQSSSQPAGNAVYLNHQPKRILEKIPNILQSGPSSYHEPDSSPILSQNFMQSIRSSQNEKQKDKQKEGRVSRENNKYLQLETQKRKTESMQKYETFEEDPRVSAIAIVEKQEEQECSEGKENLSNQRNQPENQTNTNPNYQGYYPQEYIQKLQLPPRLSLLYVPFNRLYSSPILQQVTKNQLVLARRSKTQVVASNSINRVVNGIKYKNVNLVTEQIVMYQRIMERLIKVDDILRALRERRATIQQLGEGTEEKDSVDIGIIGGHNSLKRKIHYAMIAHVYTNILTQISSLFSSDQQQPSCLFTIQHQQQQTNGDPSIISYQGELSPTLTEAENRIVYANIEAVIQQIFQQMKIKTQLSQNQDVHRIRVTRLCLQIIGDSKQGESGVENVQTISNTKIISTNKIDKQFVEELELDMVVWCVNPLFKYYEETHQMLECYSATTTKSKSAHTPGNSQISSHTPVKNSTNLTRKETKRSLREKK